MHYYPGLHYTPRAISQQFSNHNFSLFSSALFLSSRTTLCHQSAIHKISRRLQDRLWIWICEVLEDYAFSIMENTNNCTKIWMNWKPFVHRVLCLFVKMIRHLRCVGIYYLLLISILYPVSSSFSPLSLSLFSSLLCPSTLVFLLQWLKIYVTWSFRVVKKT